MAVGEAEAFHLHAAGTESESAQSAVGRDVLVLLPDGLPAPVDLDLAGVPRQFLRGLRIAAIGIQGVQQAHGNAARGPQARPFGGDVRQRRDLHAPAHAGEPQGLPDQVVFDLVGMVDGLPFRVVDVNPVVESFVDDDEYVLVDGRADDQAVFPFIEIGEIRQSARETDAQGRLGDNHGSPPIASAPWPARRAR